MEREEYKRLGEREATYFWNVGRREILQELLGRYLPHDQLVKILDVGCGPGGNIAILEKFGAVTGLDISTDALALARAHGFQELSLGSAEALPFANEQFDLVSALDVLEHVPNDVVAIDEAYRVLKPGGFFLVTVPAYQWLFSQHDRALHHMRRYRRIEMIHKLRQVGFTILSNSHFVMLAVPINLAHKIKDAIYPLQSAQAPQTFVRILPPWLNWLMLFFLRVEKCWLRYASLPFGTSIVVLAKKSA